MIILIPVSLYKGVEQKHQTFLYTEFEFVSAEKRVQFRQPSHPVCSSKWPIHYTVKSSYVWVHRRSESYNGHYPRIPLSNSLAKKMGATTCPCYIQICVITGCVIKGLHCIYSFGQS